jgi:hypothetical protein
MATVVVSRLMGDRRLAVLAEFLETHLKDSHHWASIFCRFFPTPRTTALPSKTTPQVNPELGGWEDVKRISRERST